MSTKQWKIGDAIIIGQYRYRLWRIWDETRPRLLWVLLNPSTADAEKDDRTVERCLYFTRREKNEHDGTEKYGSLEIVNLFAFRATHPRALRSAPDPIGVNNERYLTGAVERATNIVVAWGEQGIYLQQDRKALALLKRPATRPLWCLGTVQNGCPRHPSRRASDAKFELYHVPSSCHS